MNYHSLCEVQEPFQRILAERNVPEHAQPYFLRWAMTWLAETGQTPAGQESSRKARKERGGSHDGK